MANSAVVGILRALLTANSAEFEAAMQRGALSAKTFSKEMKSVGRQASEVGAALTKTLTLPIIGAAAAVGKAAIDFESSFAGVRKTVKGSEAQLAELAHGFREMAKVIPINVNELNKIGEAAGQLGIKTENILGFTEVMAKLGVTTNLSSDEAASALARLANITQMPQSEFERLGSTIVALGNDSATTESAIVEFGTRIAGAGHLAGLTEHQILAIGAAMSSVGVEAEAGGTSVQKVLNDMTEAVATGNQSLTLFAQTAGMSAAQFAEAFRTDAGAAFAAFVTGLGEQGNRAFSTLNNLGLGNERVIRAFLSLSNAGSLLTDSLRLGADAWKENTALAVEAETRFGTTASQLTKLWNRVKDVAITIGDALLPAFKSAAELLNTALPLVEKLAAAFGALPGPVQLAGIGLLAVLAAAGPAIYAFGQLALAASALSGAFAANGLATKLLAGNLVGMSTALAVLQTPITATTIKAGAAAVATTAWSAASVTLTGSLTLLGGAIAAMPIAAAVAGIGLLTVGLVKLFETSRQATLQAAETAAKQDTVNLAIARGAAATISYTDAVKFNDEWLNKRNQSLKEAADEQNRTTLTVADAAKKIEGLTKQFAEADAQVRQLAPAVRGQLAVALQETGVELKDVASAFGISELAAKRFKDQIEESEKRTKKFQEDLKDVLNTLHEVERDAHVSNFGFKGLTEGLEQVGQAFDEGALVGKMIDLREAIDGIEQDARIAAFGFKGMADELTNLGEKVVPTIADLDGFQFVGPTLAQAREGLVSFGEFARDQLGNIILGAFQGGGNVGRSIGGAVGGFLTSASGFIGKAVGGIGGAFGSVLGSVVPGLGTVLGGLAGSLFGKLFGPSEASKVRKMREEVYAAAGGVQELMIAARRAGFDTTRLFQTGNIKEFQAEVEKLRAVIAFQESAWEKVQAAVERYGFTLEELGPALQRQELDTQAQQLFEDFNVLIAAGIDSEAVLRRMADAINAFVQRSIAMGIAIPAAMRPMLQAMIDFGFLTDASGNLITDLEHSGITFAETMTQGFNRVVNSIDALTDAIRRFLGLTEEAADAVNNFPRFPNIDPPRFIDLPGGGTGGTIAPPNGPGSEDLPEKPIYGSMGGIVTPRSIQRFAVGGIVEPRGPDTVPAMLTPGELVLTRAQQGHVAAALADADRMRVSIAFNGPVFGEREYIEQTIVPVVLQGIDAGGRNYREARRIVKNIVREA